MDARAALAVLLLRKNDLESAFDISMAMIRVAPDDARGFCLTGRALEAMSAHEEAATALMQALRLNPGYIEAYISLAMAMRHMDRPADAVTSCERALELNPDAADAYYNLGHAWYDLGDLEKTLDAYRRAIAIRPDYLEAHRMLNNLLWEHQRRDEFLQSYEDALKRMPDSLGLYIDYGKYRLRLESPSDVMELFERAHARLGDSAPLLRSFAWVNAELSEWDAAFANFERSLEMDPDNNGCLQDYSRVLIRKKRYGRALEVIDRARGLVPFDQQTIAYEWLAKRLSGDQEAAQLYDYERFVRPFVLDCPPGFDGISHFNRELAAHLYGLHNTGQQPFEQSLRFGTQTHGLLFDSRHPLIVAVREQLERCVQRYIDELPADASHPLLSRNSGKFRFTGSWSVRLGPNGHHVGHVHSAGWISSAYYVEVPDDLDHENQEGWLKFGESSLSLGDREEVGKIIMPETGKLVLFPSYMYHGTVPINSAKPRMTIAFDAYPA